MIVSLGQTPTGQKQTGYRPMALQYAVTHVLTQAPDLEPFPGRQVIIQAERFAALVTQIVQTANQSGWATSPGYTWTPVFTPEEAARNLELRGYQAVDTPVVIPSPVVVVSPVPYTAPIPSIEPPPYYTPVPVVSPVPYTAPIPSIEPPPYYTPAPVDIAPPVLKQESVLKQEKGVDTNMILWLAGAVVAGLVLGGMTKQRRG